MKSLNTLLKAVGLFIVVLALLNLVGSNILATQGHSLQNINQEISALNKQNTKLNNQVSVLSSLASLQVWATQNDFVAISQPVTLATSPPLALVTE